MMKLPIQVAPVQRNFGLARHAMSAGIQPSENLCSCSGGIGSCTVSWSHCPNDYPYASCSGSLGGCLCYCNNGSGGWIGPYS
jgi:hypothetical protein